MAERLLPGLERRLKAEVTGGVRFRPLHARPLCHRRLALPDHAARRGRRRARWKKPNGRSRFARAEGVQRAAARRRLVAGRADGQRLAHHRLLEASQRASSISTSPAAAARVEPGIVLDDLNRAAQAARPVVSGRCLDRVARHHRRHDRATTPAAAARCATATRARTSSSIDALLADGSKAHFGPVAADLSDLPANSPLRPLARDLFALGAREADEIAARFPKVQRRVGGYNLDALVPGRNDVNLAHILVGSEGTLGVLHRDRTEAVAAARPARGRRLPLRQLPRGDGGGAAHRQARADRGRAGRRDHDRAGARHRHVPADARSVRARRARGAAAGRVRRGRPGRERAAARRACTN